MAILNIASIPMLNFILCTIIFIYLGSKVYGKNDEIKEKMSGFMGFIPVIILMFMIILSESFLATLTIMQQIVLSASFSILLGYTLAYVCMVGKAHLDTLEKTKFS